jgi:hypothetical protein
MSAASVLTPPPDTQRRLTETEKRSIVAAVAQGETKQSVAKRFGCHPNTVSNLCKDVAGLPTKGISSQLEAWRSKNDEGSYEAIHASVSDREDVHRAANTGLQWLKGVGVLQGDSQVNITVQAMIAAVPPEWREELIPTPALSCGTTDSGLPDK